MNYTLQGTAVRAVEAAGSRARETFRTPDPSRLDGEYTETDVKTALDTACEERALEVIRDRFPGDTIRSEEAGRVGPPDSDREWILDPLDGTNNVAAGLPTFASAVAIRDSDCTMLSAVYEPLPADTYVAERGGGVTVDGRPTRSNSDLSLSRGTVSFVLGLPAVQDPELRTEARAYKDALENVSKRVRSTWAPCVDWGLLARGTIEGVVAFRPDIWEIYAGRLLAQESGATVLESANLHVHAASDELAEDIWTALPVE